MHVASGPYINHANHDPRIHIGHTLGIISFKKFKILTLLKREAHSLYVKDIAMSSGPYIKVRQKAKIRNRYDQAQHSDTNVMYLPDSRY